MFSVGAVVSVVALATLCNHARAVVISDTVVTSGDGNFNSEVLGSLCVPEGTATITADIRAVDPTDTLRGELAVFTQDSLHSLFTNDDCSNSMVRCCGALIDWRRQPVAWSVRAKQVLCRWHTRDRALRCRCLK